MKTIFDEADLGNLHLKNRVIRSATWEALAHEDGSPSDEQLRIYDELAKGGVGGIITGFTSVDRNDCYFGGMARLSDDSLISGWAKLAEISHAQKVPVIVQLAMGEFVRNGNVLEPNDLSSAQVAEVINLFGDAARRAKSAGFDGVQIHAAHNFYLSRFISPAYNHRTDSYGGDVKGRAKILLDILADMKRKAPDFHITLKINAPISCLAVSLQTKHLKRYCSWKKPVLIRSKSAETARPWRESRRAETKRISCRSPRN